MIGRIGKMTVIAKTKNTKSQIRFNSAYYGQLLLETLPSVIQTEAEYNRTVATMNKLAVKPQLSKEADRLLDLLSALVEAYDQKHYAIPQAAPAMVIQMLRQDRGLKNSCYAPRETGARLTSS
jgi:HTH-type transcriptional regulator / antitoxin HigA